MFRFAPNQPLALIDFMRSEGVWDHWPVENSQVVIGLSDDRDVLGWLKIHEGPSDGSGNPNIVGADWERRVTDFLHDLGATNWLMVRTDEITHRPNMGDDSIIPTLMAWGESMGVTFRGLLIAGPESTSIGMVAPINDAQALMAMMKIRPYLPDDKGRELLDAVMAAILRQDREAMRDTAIEMALYMEDHGLGSGFLNPPDVQAALDEARAAKRDEPTRPENIGRPTFDIDGQEFRFQN